VPRDATPWFARGPGIPISPNLHVKHFHEVHQSQAVIFTHLFFRLTTAAPAAADCSIDKSEDVRHHFSDVSQTDNHERHAQYGVRYTDKLS